jgi:hypothetical protein
MHLEHLNSLIISQTKRLRQVLQEFNSGTIRKEISKRGYTQEILIIEANSKQRDVSHYLQRLKWVLTIDGLKLFTAVLVQMVKHCHEQSIHYVTNLHCIE